MKYDEIYYSSFKSNRGNMIYTTYIIIIPKDGFARINIEGERINHDQ